MGQPSHRRLIKRKGSSTAVGAQNQQIKRGGNKNVLKTIFPRDGNSPDGENDEHRIPPVTRLADMETQPPPTDEAERGNFPAHDLPCAGTQSHPRSDVDIARSGRRRVPARANLRRKQHVKNREENKRDKGHDVLVRSTSGNVAATEELRNEEDFWGSDITSTVRPCLSENGAVFSRPNSTKQLRPNTGGALSSFRLFLDSMQKQYWLALTQWRGGEHEGCSERARECQKRPDNHQRRYWSKKQHLIESQLKANCKHVFEVDVQGYRRYGKPNFEVASGKRFSHISHVASYGRFFLLFYGVRLVYGINPRPYAPGKGCFSLRASKNATKKDFKSVFLSLSARVHCNFKFRFVRTLFVEGGKQIERDCMRENETRRSLKTSLPAERGDAHGKSFARVEIKPGVSSLMLPVRKPPYWLNSKYVVRHALQKTRQLVETKAKPDKKDVDTKNGRESLYIGHNVYSMSTDFLRESRVAARKRFFQDLRFALRPWEASRGIPEEFGQPNIAVQYPVVPQVASKTSIL